MKKQLGKNQSFDVPQKKKASVPLPEVVNMDDIATMTDDVLIENLRSLETAREKAIEERIDTVPWEIEACYVRRELQLRRVRHSAHENYLQQLDQEAVEAARQEHQYPVADLNNSSFMFFN